MQQSPINDDRNFALEDLDVQQAEEIKGGPTHQSKIVLILRSSLSQETEN